MLALFPAMLLGCAQRLPAPAQPLTTCPSTQASTRQVSSSQPSTTQASLPRVRLERMVKVDKPVYLTHDPAGRIFIVEQEGRVLLWENGALAKTPYLDLTDKTYVDFEGGLLSIAFHPRFLENGRLYVFYTTRVPDPTFPVQRTESGRVDLKSIVLKQQICVSEFHVDPKASEVDLATERIVLSIDKPYLNHNGGQLQFGPDGYLYISTGDGGSTNDPDNNAQNPQSLLGKVLRIDVAPRQGYAVPKDNPFVAKHGWAPEIWALGFRNPWRFSFDRLTGQLYLGDVGQEDWEEVDRIERGGNYGWRIREGAHDAQPVDHPPMMIDPIFEYAHYSNSACVTGGYVYRGTRMPTLRGWYLCGDYSHGEIYGLFIENGKVTASGMIVIPSDASRDGGQRPTQPSSFGEDADGELYLCDINGWVYRLMPE